MLRLVPGAERVDIPAAGHMVVCDEGDVFVGCVEAFLDSVP